MTGRDDLDELHALAASIAEDKQGWRAHRRHRAQSAARARLEAQMVAPVKRRIRHRWVAVGAVVIVAIVGATLFVTHRPGKPAPAQKRTTLTVRQLPSEVREGQAAAIALRSDGRTANLFSCQGWYETQHLSDVTQQSSISWHAGYLQACAQGG